MGVVLEEEPEIIHATPGRVRLHLPGWVGQGKHHLEMQLRQIPGIGKVQANPLTSNVLIHFDKNCITEAQIIQSVRHTEVNAVDETVFPPLEEELVHPPVLKERAGKKVRARIAVRGLDRDPRIASTVLGRLKAYEGVHASANLLTGRVLVEFREHEVDLDDLIAEIENVEMPELPGEDRPSHPLDPGPLIQGATRLIGASLGLGLLATRRLIGTQTPLLGAGIAVQVASTLGILQGIPPFRYGLRKLLGRTAADLVVNIPTIITLTLSGSPLGLALASSESLRLVTEVYARRAAWRRHEERVESSPSAQPDAILHLERSERPPRPALVLEGTGTAIGRDGMPSMVKQGVVVSPGAPLYGGPFVVQLQKERGFTAFTPEHRPAATQPTLYERYLKVISPLSLLYAVATGILTRSFSQAMASLLLINPRTAAIGLDVADLGTSARVLRAGVTVVGTRKNRPIRQPHAIFLDGARLLSEKLEVFSVLPLSQDCDATEILARAAGIAAAAGSPWGNIFHSTGVVTASEGSFDGKTAFACVEKVRYTLGPVENWHQLPEAARLRQRGSYVLALCTEREELPMGLLAIRPGLATGVTELVQYCQQQGIELGVLTYGDQIAVQALARRARVGVIESEDAVEAIRTRQRDGKLVAFVSDTMSAAEAFAACDLAIGLTDDRYRLPARADLLAPDLRAIIAVLEATQRREKVVRDSVILSAISNVIGLFWGLQGRPGIEQASQAVYMTALGATADGWLRLRGGQRTGAFSTRIADPHPERWGQRDIHDVLKTLRTTDAGLTNEQAERRKPQAISPAMQHPLFSAFLEQIRSPLLAILMAGAGLSLLLGATGDVVIIGSTILANVGVGVWQERKANKISEALQRIGTPTARVLRNKKVQTLSADEIVPGDVLMLAAGDRVAADARVISAQGLEVDESALTGESLPIAKYADRGNDSDKVILQGSDVTAGTGKAVVVAVGRQTRMGATTAALTVEENEQNPLGVRLGRLLRLILPISAGGGLLVILIGVLRRGPFATIIGTGATMALTGLPEGLPLLSRVSEAGVARRLAGRQAVVRRLSAIEALGRVDVACTDKTGTLTEGHLAVSLVADYTHESEELLLLPEALRHVVLTAGIASPAPDAPGVHAHPTDVAVLRAAEVVGVKEQLYQHREAERSFDPTRSFHASLVDKRVCLKGAPETLLGRCKWMVSENGARALLKEDERQKWLERANSLAQRGLRVLMVAEGDATVSLEQPQDLTALGFLGISDPLREGVEDAVRRCKEAGVRVIMITGDHPVTARAIGREAGLLDGVGSILTGQELAELHNGELDQRLEDVTVVARATPLDKLRIIESLQRSGHTVAMTGDGVNDAPALRLANVGVAMGKGSTEVARQTADVVLTNDDFCSLVEALVEGRSFWRNLRRALGLLLGGNLGELGLVIGATLFGLNFPLTSSQILAMNAITDILPATAVALQPPEHRSLAALKREGAQALDRPLRNDIVLRGLATALPSIVTYAVMLTAGSLPLARSVAYGSVIMAQLAQTLDSGRSAHGLTRPVMLACFGSAAILLLTFTVPWARSFLCLVIPTPLGWGLIAFASLASVLLSRVFAFVRVVRPHRILLEVAQGQIVV